VQTLNVNKYIIIDGGSTDGSIDFLGGIQNPNVQWISEPDMGGLSSNYTQLFEERERVFAEMWEMRFWRAIISIYRFIRYTLLHLPKPRLN
jgi:hypothetical protein